ncbi:MAG TPA: JAB domain-containing protein [Polyangia bacterium]|nr:JAB domain-containing protein [Polyangia bacterium]
MTLTGMTEVTFAEMVRDARRAPRYMLGDSPFKGAVREPADIVAAWPELKTAEREVVGILTLNTRMVASRRVVVSLGSLNASIVHPREVFRPAILYSAAAIALVHNHPSGEVDPSEEDLAITDRLVKVGTLLGIQVLDHVIIGSKGFYSMRAHGDAGLR